MGRCEISSASPQPRQITSQQERAFIPRMRQAHSEKGLTLSCLPATSRVRSPRQAHPRAVESHFGNSGHSAIGANQRIPELDADCDLVRSHGRNPLRTTNTGPAVQATPPAPRLARASAEFRRATPPRASLHRLPRRAKFCRSTERASPCRRSRWSSIRHRARPSPPRDRRWHRA